ncbi:uncharacterized protein [Procambarus clarkii]|uniref:uncharacterized protein n=1 Tax=Procambarus clarkii TaxID=6728 RepID=UPI0037426394
METGRDSDDGLPLMLMALRDTYQESLGCSPNSLVFGHEVRSPLTILRDKLVGNPKSVVQVNYIHDLQDKLNKNRAKALIHLKEAQGKMKAQYDKKTKQRYFEAGDKVVVLMERQGPTLLHRFQGPYTVIKKLSPTNYVIQTPDLKKKEIVVYVNRIKLTQKLLGNYQYQPGA